MAGTSPHPKSSDAASSVVTDPMDAFYALNLGDFVSENFISDALIEKISNRVADSPERLQRQLEELIDIYALENTLSVLGLELNSDYLIYDSISGTLKQMMSVDACHILQLAKKEVSDHFLGLTGTSTELSPDERWKVGREVSCDDLWGKALLNQQTVLEKDVPNCGHWQPVPGLHPSQKNDSEQTSHSGSSVQSVLVVPMIYGNESLGVLSFESYTGTEFTEEHQALAESTARVFVCSIQLQQAILQAKNVLYDSEKQENLDLLQNTRAQITDNIANLGQLQQQFVEDLGAAIDARHDFTRGHSKRVANLAKALGEHFELNDKTLDLVYYAGLLGNLGKLSVPDDLLSKEGHLTDNEWDKLHNHPNVGVALLSQLHILSEILPYVHHQQERWDGTGSPDGLREKNIPFGSRLLAVAAAYDALVSERPYRGDKAFSHAEAMDILQGEVGKKWDPLVVQAFSTLPESSWE